MAKLLYCYLNQEFCMKLTILLISFGFALQLVASNKNADGNASAAASAESDSKLNASAERDVKSYASQPYTAFMHPYAIVADLTFRGLDSDAIKITKAIEYLPIAHQAIIMALKFSIEESSRVRRQCDEYTRRLCQIIDIADTCSQDAIIKYYIVEHPELLRPLNEREQETVAALNNALSHNFVRDLFPLIAGYAIDGFRYGRAITDVGVVSPLDTSIHWVEQAVDDLTNLGTGNAQVPKIDETSNPIKVINFACNPIRSLPEAMGRHLSHIESCFCNDCLLEEIHPQAFEGMENLLHLNLANNLLTSLPDEILVLPTLRHIDLSGNPLTDATKQKLEAWKKSKGDRVVHYDQNSTNSVVVDPYANAATSKERFLGDLHHD
jgi:hypothetical protein